MMCHSTLGVDVSLNIEEWVEWVGYDVLLNILE